MSGASPAESAAHGAAIASVVIGHHGALIEHALLPE
jgi:2-dehydro-3-deoxygluconokinase